jgi:predicted SprT family Zn-dependent metalloprotease
MARAKSNIDTKTQITEKLNRAFDHFNNELFSGSLPRPIFKMIRKKNGRGHFSRKRWVELDEKRNGIVNLDSEFCDEISLNPDLFIARTDEDILSTLVHEMVHQRQYEEGSPGKNGYHNKEWAEMMKDVGLYPSRTGEFGGKEVGPSCSHYIVENDLYQLSYKKLEKSGFKLDWGSLMDTSKEQKKKPEQKIKYTCDHCRNKAWGKPDMIILCGTCTADTGEIVQMVQKGKKAGQE